MSDTSKNQAGFSGEPVFQTEDLVKEHLVAWLNQQGWKAEVSWGRKPGADIIARRDGKIWIIEVKGQGTLPPMRVNYFLAVLGETLQRMKDSSTAYSVAFPDMMQYRNLWERLPLLAKQRTNISALFVDSSGHVSHNVDAIASEDATPSASVIFFSPPESSYFEISRSLTKVMTKSEIPVLVVPKEYVDNDIFGKAPLASIFLSGLRWPKVISFASIRKCVNPIVLTSNPALLGSWQLNPVMGLLPDHNASKNLITALNYLRYRQPKFVSEAKEFVGLGFGWVREDLVS